MWGTTATAIVATPGGGLAGGGTTVQLAKINYARPDTWSFLLSARIVSLESSANVVLQASFFVMTGLGRSVFVSPTPNLAAGFFSSPQTPFCQFIWRAIPGATLPENIPFNPRWTTETLGSPFDDAAAAVAVQPVCRWFPAQDIQCGVVLGIESAAAAQASVEVGAYFAPRSHMRPEWFGEHGEQFRGNENGGT